MSDRGTSRRRFLGGIAASGLAGATFVGSGAASDGSATGDGRASARAAAVTSSHREWPMFGQDAQNTSKTDDKGPQDGVAVNWEADLSATVHPVVTENYVYVGTEDAIVSYSTADGERRWRKELDGAVSATPAVYDRSVYVPVDDGTLRAFSTRDAEEDWTYELEGVPAAPAITTANEPEVYVADEAGYVYEIEPPTGFEQWKYDSGGATFSTPLVVSNGTESVYAVADDGTVHMLNFELGRARWTENYAYSATSSPPLVSGNYLYLADDGGTVYGIDSRNGDQLWTFDADGAVSASVATERQQAYVATEGGTLYAITKEEGEQNWQTDLGAGVSTEIAIGENGLFVPTDDGMVRHLDRDGEEVWRAQLSVGTPSIALATQVFAVGDGVAALEGGDQTVITTETPTPTATPTETATPSATPTETATPTPSATAAPTATPTDGATPTATPTETATASATESPTPTPSPAQSPTPTPTATQAPTPTATSTATMAGGSGEDTDDAATTGGSGPLPAWLTLAGIGGLAALGLRRDADGDEE